MKPVHENRSFCGLKISKMKRPDCRSGLFQSWSGPVAVFVQSWDRTFKHYLYAFLLIIWIFFLQDILKKYHFDLPAGIEHNYSNWEKIMTFVSYSVTQTQARVKKLICMIIKIIKNKNAHSFSQIWDSITQNTNIFALAQVIVHRTPCRPTVQLCSRVVLMVSITFLPNDNLNYVSMRFIKSAMEVKSIETLLTNASCWCADWQDLMLLRQ